MQNNMKNNKFQKKPLKIWPNSFKKFKAIYTQLAFFM